MARQASVNGLALGVATAGGLLIYAGLRGENPLAALRGVLTGSPAPVPAGKPVTVELPNWSGGTGDWGSGTFSGTGAAGVGKAVSIALAQVGKPYKWGGKGPSVFDCSGLISYAYIQAGLMTGYLTSWGFATSTKFRKVKRQEVQAGDVLWRTGHVALYIGNGQIVEAPRTGIPVRTRTVKPTEFSLTLRFVGPSYTFKAAG
jgi:cell wall-associated NlpC family hydrolase